jgi:hypothetical protein
MSLVLPFVACRSRGGPFDDDSFTAGFQCGEIDRALAVAGLVGAQQVRFPTVYASLLPQLDLVAMRHLYQLGPVRVSEQTPLWADVTFVLCGTTAVGDD